MTNACSPERIQIVKVQTDATWFETLKTLEFSGILFQDLNKLEGWFANMNLSNFGHNLRL